MSRDEKLLQLRPTIELDTDQSLPEQHFAAVTLRPVLKLQHHLLIALFNHYLVEKSINLSSMSAFKQRLAIENAIKRDLPLRHTLMGCIIGHFTGEEYDTYCLNRVAYHKRLTGLLIQRISDALIKADPIY
jgi:hypothetical protein